MIFVPRVIILKRHTLAMPLPPPPDLRGRVAIVTGGSRGIGREVCLALARAGAHVVVAAKSASPQPTLPGTIHTVADEIRALRTGAEAFPYALDLRDESACVSCVRDVVARFGRVDILVNNASALWWHTIPETPTRKYDLRRRETRRAPPNLAPPTRERHPGRASRVPRGRANRTHASRSPQRSSRATPPETTTPPKATRRAQLTAGARAVSALRV